MPNYNKDKVIETIDELFTLIRSCILGYIYELIGMDLDIQQFGDRISI